MQIKSFLCSFVLPALVLADGASIIAALNSVTNSAAALNNTVAEFSGNPLTLLPILSDAADLLFKTKNGDSTAKNSAPLSVTETVNLLGPTNALTTAVQNTVSTIIQAKPKFDKILLSNVILADLLLQQKASNSFADDIVAKVPTSLTATAQSLVQPIRDALTTAVAAYQP